MHIDKFCSVRAAGIALVAIFLVASAAFASGALNARADLSSSNEHHNDRIRGDRCRCVSRVQHP